MEAGGKTNYRSRAQHDLGLHAWERAFSNKDIEDALKELAEVGRQVASGAERSGADLSATAARSAVRASKVITQYRSDPAGIHMLEGIILEQFLQRQLNRVLHATKATTTFTTELMRVNPRRCEPMSPELQQLHDLALTANLRVTSAHGGKLVIADFMQMLHSFSDPGWEMLGL